MTKSPATATLTVDVNPDGVALITLDRPPVNALDLGVLEELQLVRTSRSRARHVRSF